MEIPVKKNYSIFASAIYWVLKCWKEREKIEKGWKPTVLWRRMTLSYAFRFIQMLSKVCWRNSTLFLLKEFLWVMEIEDFKPDLGLFSWCSFRQNLSCSIALHSIANFLILFINLFSFYIFFKLWCLCFYNIIKNISSRYISSIDTFCDYPPTSRSFSSNYTSSTAASSSAARFSQRRWHAGPLWTEEMYWTSKGVKRARAMLKRDYN